MNDSDKPETMPDELIANALKKVRARLVDADRQRAELERSVVGLREEERLLAQLLELRRGNRRESTEYSGPASEEPASPTIAKSAVETVIGELNAAGRTVHISELMRLLQARSIPIPGAGAQANLIAHLRRDPRIVRPSRGMYGLATWGLESMPSSGRRRRKRRVRVVRTEGANE